MRGRDILRLPVITRDIGKKVSQVEDLILDRQGTHVLGIVVSEKLILGGTKVVPWSAILVVGLDAVIIDSESSVVKASEVPEMNEVLERGFVLEGSRVQTTEGRDLGKIQNFFFDSSTGVVEGYELIGGLNDQQPSGSSFMPTPGGFEAGKDYVFVDPSAGPAMEDLATALNARGR